MTALVAYARERLPVRLFAPAIALLAVMAWSTGTMDLSALPGAGLLMTALVVQFRVWDDLEDVERDRVQHPARVLTRSSLRPFRRANATLLIATAATVANAPVALMAYALAGIVMLAGYRVARHVLSDVSWRYGVLLFKYPAFVAIVALVTGAPNLTALGLAAAAAYGVAAAYEVYHSHRRPARQQMRAAV